MEIFCVFVWFVFFYMVTSDKFSVVKCRCGVGVFWLKGVIDFLLYSDDDDDYKYAYRVLLY